MENSVEGADYSVWDDDNSTPQHVDFAKAKYEGLQFVSIKVSQSTWLDEDFLINWHNAKLAFVRRFGFHFHTWDASAKDQAKTFVSALKADPGEMEPAFDYECRTNPPTKAQAITQARIFVDTVEQSLGRAIAIYTSPGYWREFGSTDPFWAQHKLWIANTQVLKPTIPEPWTDYWIWQHTFNGDGLKYGSEAKSVDLDYFNGTQEQFDAAYPPLGPATTIPDYVTITAGSLRLRSSSDTSQNELGQLFAGTRGKVSEEVTKDGNIWDHITLDGWIARHYDGNIYAK